MRTYVKLQWERLYISIIYVFLFFYFLPTSFILLTQEHDDIIKWKHFPGYRPFVQGIHQSPVNSPSQRPVMRSSDGFLDLRLNKHWSKQSWGWCFETPSRSLWRHCNETNPFLPNTLTNYDPALSQGCFWFAPSQWETALLCNDVSHWLGASIKSALLSYHTFGCMLYLHSPSIAIRLIAMPNTNHGIPHWYDIITQSASPLWMLCGIPSCIIPWGAMFGSLNVFPGFTGAWQNQTNSIHIHSMIY